jgi:DNA-binding response OmpR family regulator
VQLVAKNIETMELSKTVVNSILIIDDDRDDYELVLEAVKKINPSISVYYISGWDEAAKFQNQKFDLVLLDINMPQHDGFTWLKSLREKCFADLPIIMYTNSLSPVHISKAYEQGANLYFSKPESFSKLQRALQKLISMDWSSPFLITEKYRVQGQYKTFQVE